LGRKPIDVIVGERLATLRTVRGVSSDRLGSILGIGSDVIANYEAGVVRIPPAHVIEICKFFQVAIKSLFPSFDRDHDPTLH
jgi:transcriptional regulator with XRE-family HTH domain